MTRLNMPVLLLGLIVLFGGGTVQAQVVLDTPRFALHFDADGTPSQFIEKQTGRNLHADHRRGQGFVATLQDEAGKKQDVLLRVTDAGGGMLLLSHDLVKVRAVVKADYVEL